MATDSAGDYTLESHPSARFVSLVLPSGYRIPTTRKGTVALHRPLQPGRTREAELVFELEPLETPDTQHAFLLLADPQTENRLETERLHRETVPDVQATVARLGDRHTFGVSCGDIMFDDLTLYPEYERAVAGMGIPFFQVVGNHDLDQDAPSDRDTTRTFQRHFGPTYYAFNRGEVHYVVLDDVLWYGTGYVGYLDADQVDWLASDLKLVPPGATVVVSLHIPLDSSMSARTGGPDAKIGQTVNNREALYRLLEPYRAHVLAGHTHELEHRTQGRLREHIHGTVCGAWWSGQICWDGTPNGYEVYEVNGSDLRWEYRATGQQGNPQLRVYPKEPIPRPQRISWPTSGTGIRPGGLCGTRTESGAARCRAGSAGTRGVSRSRPVPNGRPGEAGSSRCRPATCSTLRSPALPLASSWKPRIPGAGSIDRRKWPPANPSLRSLSVPSLRSGQAFSVLSSSPLCYPNGGDDVCT